MGTRTRTRWMQRGTLNGPVSEPKGIGGTPAANVFQVGELDHTFALKAAHSRFRVGSHRQHGAAPACWMWI